MEHTGAMSPTSSSTQTCLLLLLLLLTWVDCNIDHTQPSSVTIRPGEALRVTCKVTGASITDSSYWATAWIRQPAGQALEWINTIFYNENKQERNSLKNKFSVSRDTSSNTITLQGQNMQHEDSAVYYWVESLEHTQPSSVAIRPRENLQITCKVSGMLITSSSYYRTAWIRQQAGQALEWINAIDYDGEEHHSDKLKNKFSISRDTSSNTVTLQGQNLQAEDTAVYYCARDTL
ncbi:hypothetical protein ACEWY4_003210 [Coilia grayii]|uniref:Ig-like domain-containing protein n=1 Tax=Coilia grayii TaxID=363190 RepID=A0ABD1KQN4_9TELE